MPDAIRVLVADDHGVVREGLRTLLTQAGFQVVGLAASGEETLHLAQTQHPHVVLLDIRMPDLDGLHVLARMRQEVPQVRVIILTTYDNPTYLMRALELGAAGFLTKDAPPQAIPLAVQAAVHGQVVLDDAVLQRALADWRVRTKPMPVPTPPVEDLTEQEVRVLRLIAQGLTNQDIAKRLHISQHTVKTHLKHIFSKLGVSDRTQAAVWAWRQGLAE